MVDALAVDHEQHARRRLVGVDVDANKLLRGDGVRVEQVPGRDRRPCLQRHLRRVTPVTHLGPVAIVRPLTPANALYVRFEPLIEHFRTGGPPLKSHRPRDNPGSAAASGESRY